jgi:hypothetical protein
MVVFLMTRAIAVLTIAVLAGTPALVAACVTACMPGASHASAAHDVVAANDGTEPHGAADAHHQHHHAPDDGATDEASEQVRLTGIELSCCPFAASTSLDAALAPARADAGALVAPMSVSAASALLRAPVFAVVPFASPPISPPSPARAPLVLRI